MLTAAVLSEFFRDRLWDHCAEMNAALKMKRDAVLSGLQDSVGDICAWSRPAGKTLSAPTRKGPGKTRARLTAVRHTAVRLAA